MTLSLSWGRVFLCYYVAGNGSGVSGNNKGVATVKVGHPYRLEYFWLDITSSKSS